jgi:hypothetical protein
MLIKGTRGVGLGLLPKAKYGRIALKRLKIIIVIFGVMMELFKY